MPPRQLGRPRHDDRRMLNGLLWKLATGVPWRDLPERYGPWQTLYTRFRRWTRAGARHPARRWVIERTNSWHNRFRKLRIRYEKEAENYLGLVEFAGALIVYRLRLLLR